MLRVKDSNYTHLLSANNNLLYCFPKCYYVKILSVVIHLKMCLHVVGLLAVVLVMDLPLILPLSHGTYDNLA